MYRENVFGSYFKTYLLYLTHKHVKFLPWLNGWLVGWLVEVQTKLQLSIEIHDDDDDGDGGGDDDDDSNIAKIHFQRETYIRDTENCNNTDNCNNHNQTASQPNSQPSSLLPF